MENDNIYKILKVENIKNMSTESLIEAFKNGFRIEEYGHVKNLNVPCPSCNKNVEKSRSYEPSKLSVKSEIQNDRGEPLSLNPATCPVGSLYVGQTLRLSATPSGGTPPYDIYFYVKDTVTAKSTLLDKVSGTYTFDYTLAVADAGTGVIVRTTVIDSCPTSPRSVSDSCTLAYVLNCPPPAVTMSVTIV